MSWEYEVNEHYERGYGDGWFAAMRQLKGLPHYGSTRAEKMQRDYPIEPSPKKKRRKKSAWQKYVANKRNQIKYKSGKRKGMLNLKAMGVQYRKKKRR